MAALKAFRYAMGRADYMREIRSVIQSARRRILFTSASMQRSTAADEQRMVLEAVQHRESAGLYEHRGIVARVPDTVPGALELLWKTRVQVKMSAVLSATRLRFVVGDEQQCILGVAGGEASIAHRNPSDFSFIVDSNMLGLALQGHFERLWTDPGTISVWQYLREMVDECSRTGGDGGRRHIRGLLSADELGIPDWWLAENLPTYRRFCIEALSEAGIVANQDKSAIVKEATRILALSQNSGSATMPTDWLETLVEEWCEAVRAPAK
ncbi:MAG: hypothetical protein IT379_30715 [Deltaproteobacteria bacterium]|nr:hypothetical protein [Deltaproteobacteria bacterium]